MIKIILLVIFYFAFPLFIIYLCKKWSFLQKMGAIVLAYGVGLLIGSTGILPQGSNGYKLALQGKASLPETEVESLITQGKATNEDYQ
jgi:peptidoglycan/LPS O-acetylase OafA/YrhL